MSECKHSIIYGPTTRNKNQYAGYVVNSLREEKEIEIENLPTKEKIKEWIGTLDEIEKVKDKSRVLKYNVMTVRDQLLKMLGEATLRE